MTFYKLEGIPARIPGKSIIVSRDESGARDLATRAHGLDIEQTEVTLRRLKATKISFRGCIADAVAWLGGFRP